MGFASTLVVLVVVLALSWRFLGSYMEAVYDGRVCAGADHLAAGL